MLILPSFSVKNTFLQDWLTGKGNTDIAIGNYSYTRLPALWVCVLSRVLGFTSETLKPKKKIGTFTILLQMFSKTLSKGLITKFIVEVKAEMKVKVQNGRWLELWVTYSHHKSKGSLSPRAAYNSLKLGIIELSGGK